MAELMVKVQYASKVRATALTTLRVLFPFWGVVAPLGAVICLIGIFVCSANASIGDQALWLPRLWVGLLTGIVSPVVALLATRWLSVDCIVADKLGLQMPFMMGNLRGFLPWSEVGSVMYRVGKDANDRGKLAFVTKQNRTVTLNLSRLNDAEIEQLLLAAEMWAPMCQKDPSIEVLQNSLKKAIPASEQSFTGMWEDELRRRFCATAFMPLEPGTFLRNGTLKVIRHLALGGLSALYLCQLQDKQLVVVKEAVVPEDSAESVQAKAREMFEREAQLLMKLNHANVVKVMDHFVDGGRNYLMLEYVNGQDLRQFIKQNGPQKEHVVLEWAIQIANILKHLHEQDPPIIHRDLTPDNLVLRADGQIVLIDFGAANEFIGNATGTFVGKQSFIAPEQFRGKASIQSDIYALGCTLHFALTGQEPEALATSEPREVDENISEEMNEFVVSCTQMEQRDRFATAAQMLPILRKMAASVLVS